MDIIDRVNLLLSERGITGAEMSRALGLSNAVYSQWNKRKTKPSKRTIRAMADYFGVTVSFLVGESELTADNSQKSEVNKKIPASVSADGDEEEFIHFYRSLSPEDRERALAVLRALSSRKDN